jgi:hypothetical protein
LGGAAKRSDLGVFEGRMGHLKSQKNRTEFFNVPSRNNAIFNGKLGKWGI